MSTLLLRLAAPMQSWGADSKYNIRKTNREPTKSGVLGMISAALGCRRDDAGTFARLSQLRFGVRVDHEGTIMQDYQTVHRVLPKKKADAQEKFETTLTYRDYLHDAVFVAGLEGPREELEQVEEALSHPVYPLFLGRRSCPPTGRICLGIEETDLESALRSCPWQVPEWRQARSPKKLRLIMDSTDPREDFDCLYDVPVSYSPLKREYSCRNIHHDWVTISDGKSTEHDPMSELWEVLE